MNTNRYRSLYENTEAICELCSGELTKKEISVKLCPCRFQICSWCLSKILQDNMTCPNCGRNYPKHVIHLLDNFSESQYSDSSSLWSIEHERRKNSNSAKTAQHDMSYLQSVRIIQRNLVYIIGLSPSITDQEMLRSPQLFGQYGTIKKVILNNSPQLIEKVHSCCAYITYSKPQEALDCIMATDGCVLFNSQIRSSFGTTKYCNFFLRGIRCTNAECMYLHQIADDEDCFTKKDMTTRQAEFYSRTHPCHSDMVDVPIGENLTSLPPLNTQTNDESYIKSSFFSVFGDTTTSKLDYSCYLDGMLIDRPFQTERVLVDDNERCQAISAMMSEDSIQGFSLRSPIDFPFLLNVDEFIKRVQQANNSIESWDWRECSRSNSIDSNIPVEV